MTGLEAPAIESYRHRETSPEVAKAAARCVDSVAALEGALSGTPPYLVGSRFRLRTSSPAGCWRRCPGRRDRTVADDRCVPGVTRRPPGLAASVVEELG